MATKHLVCLVLFAAASAVPLIRDDFDPQSDVSSYQCARQCKGSRTKFDYQPDMTYIYEYKAEAETSVAGASEDKARMYIQTTAKIEVINQCEFALRLEDVKLYHSKADSDNMEPCENTREFQRNLVENTVRFSFDDGIIRDICHPSQEKIWVLNFKRGLLSAFQNSMDDLKKDETVWEMDVTGECQAEYTKTGGWIWQRDIKVSKSKNLLACYQHSGMRTTVPMVPYRVDSDIQSLPIMKSTHKCDFEISSSRILKSAICKESHVFAPFSNRQSGGSTQVQQKLEYISSKRGIETHQENIEVRSNLLFKHVNGIDEVQNSKQVVEQKLKEICDQTQNDIRPETPRLFNEIVRGVKNLDSSDLKDIYNKLKDRSYCRQGEKAMKFFVDTFPIAGTEGAVKLMSTVINNDEVPDVEKKVWLTSLSLIPEPTEDMIPSLMKLLNGDYADQALLPVSALLNTMCRKNVDCDKSYKFKRIVNKISGKIDSYCNSEDRTQTMETLRAIGNVGHGQDFLKTLKTCLSSRYSPLEVKVAAADAYRRFQCQETEDNGEGILMEILEMKNADSELRIMSFLSLMRCPTDPVLQKVAAQLSREEDVNVGTFIYTHLEHLKQTADPHKQDVAEAVKRLDLKTFDDGSFKVSRSRESSKLINRLNVGYVANGDLIWSQNSMVPRALRVNLTAEMFGNSINFFDAGIRMDGLDRFVQKILGTEEYFKQNKASPEDLEAFMYARTFGNELFFKHVKGSHEYEKAKTHLNLNKLLENLSKKYDFEHTHSQQFMDQSLIIPTIIGLPINMTMNSTMSVDVKTNGEIDLSGVLSRSKPITVTSNVAVSAGIEVTGSMMVDAMLYKQGVRMRNTLHSNANMRASLKITNRQIVDFEMWSPEEKQEIFDARSQFFIVHDHMEKEQEMIKENRREMRGCTGDKFAKITGVELCGELQYPNASMVEDAPYFPLTGPVRATLVMEKKDTHGSYKIFAKWNRNSKKLEAQLQLDTPGSRVDRHISADVTVGDHKSPHIDLVLISPWKKIVVNSKAARNKAIASLTGSVLIDDSKLYRLTSKVETQNGKRVVEYMPFVEIESESERITLLKGNVSYKRDETNVRVQLEVQDLKQKKYTVEGQLINNTEEKRIDISAGRKGDRPYKLRIGTSHKLSGRNDQNIEINPEIQILHPEKEIVSFKSHGVYRPKPMKVAGNVTFKTDLIKMRQPVTLEFNVLQRKQKYPVTGSLKTSTMSANVKGDVHIGKTASKTTMTLKYRTNSKKETIEFSGKLLNRSKKTFCKYIAKSTMKFKTMPEYNTESEMEITHKNKKVNMDVGVKFTDKSNKNRGKQPDIKMELSANIQNLKDAEIKADLKAKIPGNDMDIDVHVGHQHNLKKKTLDSKVKLHLVPFIDNDINADISAKDDGQNLLDVTAIGNLEAYGKKYNLKSDLLQKSKKRFQHSITISNDKQEKHFIATVYKNINGRHQMHADIESSRLDKPLDLQAIVELNKPTDFLIRGALNENDKELYSVNALSKLEDIQAGKWKLELAHPERKVKAQVDFTKIKDRIDTDAVVNWNVRSRERPAPEVRLTSQFTRVTEDDTLLLKSNIKIKTPFESFESLSSNLNLEKSESDLKSTGQISYKNARQFYSQVTAKLPISIENAEMSLHAKTPFENYRDIKVDLQHKLDSEINTHLKARVDKELNELIIKGTKEVRGWTRNVQGKVVMKTPYQSIGRIDMNFDHTDDENKIETAVQLKKDDDKYNVDLKLSRDIRRSKTERKGKLIISGPTRSAQTSFKHTTNEEKHQFEASLRSRSTENSRRDEHSIDVTGFYQNSTHHSLNVNVNTPKKAKGIALEIENALESSQLKSKILFEIESFKNGYALDLKNQPKDISLEVDVFLGPLVKVKTPLHLKSSLQYDNSPMTVSGQIGWAPSSIMGFSGSYKAEALDDIEVNLKLTTPYENVKNIDVLVSHVLRNSVRVAHLNIDHNEKKTVDIEVRSQNDDERKEVRVKVYIPCSHFQSLDTGVIIDARKGVSAKADIELRLKPEEKYQGTITVKVNGGDNIRGKINVNTPIVGLEQIEGTFVRNGRKDDKRNTLTLTNGDEKLIDIKSETEVKRDRVNIRIVAQGKILPHIAEVVDELRVLPKLHEDRDGNKIQQLIVEVQVKEQEKTMQVDGSLISDFGRKQDKLSSTIRIIGDEVRDFDIYLSLARNARSIHGNLVLKLKDDVEIKALFTDLFGGKHGIEYIQSGDSDKSEYKGKVYFQELRMFESSIELTVSSIRRIEFVFTAKSDVKGYELTKVKYTHEGQDNRASCSFSVEDVKGIKASIDLVGQTSPIHLFSLIVKTPINDYKKIIISGDYDETKINGLIQLNDYKQLSLSGAHSNFKNPKFTLKTPLRHLQVLSVNVDGELLDGSSSFTLQFNDNDRIDGNVEIKYDSPSQVEIIAQLKPKIDRDENIMKFEVKTTEQPRRTHLLVAVNDKNQIKFDSQLETENSYDKQQRVDLEIKYPALGLQTRGFHFNLKGSKQKHAGKIQLFGESERIVDADINLDFQNDVKATLVVRQPKYMEYRFTRENFPRSNDNELSFNWDRNDPDASLVIRARHNDESTSTKMDKSMSLKLSCPSRSIGVEHSIIATRNDIQSSGKIYWNADRESELSYQLELKDNSDKRQASYDGKLKVKLPTRTVGIAGHAKDDDGEYQAGTTLSWDLDKNPNKKIGINARVQKGSHTQADVSLILPEDAHVDSKLVMNKGNTILEGQTQIFYSDDSRKTLTLFSKLENKPGDSSFFYPSNTKYNYSIQLGMSHPDSSVDVKMVSHLGEDSDRLTTSLGIDYLTSRKQNKNMDLFMEINRLKKEIHLRTSNPYKAIDVRGSIKHNPMEMLAVTTVENQVAWSARFAVDQRQKKIQLDFTNEDKVLQYSAGFPNRTSLLLQRERQENGRVERDIKLLIELATPYLLQSDLRWKPGMLAKIRDRIFDVVKQNTNDLIALSKEISSDVKTQARAKYDDIVASVIDDAKQAVRSVEQELTTVENELDQIQRNLLEPFEFCQIEIRDFKLEEEIVHLQKKLQDIVGKLNTAVKSYTSSYRDTLRALSRDLERMRDMSFDEAYEKVINEIARIENRIFNTFIVDVLKFLHSLSPEVLEDIWQLLHDALVGQYDPRAIIDELNRGMEEFKNEKISSIIAKMGQRKLQVVSKIKIVLNKLGRFVSEHPATKKAADILEENANELYQVIRWTISYLDVKNELPRNMDILADYLRDMLEEELKELMGPVYRFVRNPVTKFDPDQGVLQAEVPLVIPIERLDKIPTILEVSENVADYVEKNFGTNNTLPSPAPM